MYTILFFISCVAAIAFMCFGTRTNRKWVRNSFFLYGSLFTMITLGLGILTLQENKPVVRQALRELTGKKEQTVLAEKVLTSEASVKDTIRLQAPLIQQLPELPRGCEITSLAMLLRYHGVQAEKMELAKQVKKNPAVYKVSNGKTYFGNPHNGFVGDMHSFEKPGLGVYHDPIAQLAAQYIGADRVYDFSGSDFSEIITQLNEKRPVWVIINATYKKLPEKEFIMWQTEDGPMKVTKREHSVLITGYDEHFIYFNDPLNRTKKAPMNQFKAAWEQMGKQAITIR